MNNTPKITEFQKAAVGSKVIVKRYGNKTSKGIVTKKLPGALVVDINDNLVVIDADKVIKTV